MKHTLILLAATATLMACAPRTPLPTLPEGAATQSFQFTETVLRRGVRGGSKTQAPSLIDRTWAFTCLTEGQDGSAKSRASQAFATVQKKFGKQQSAILGDSITRSSTSKSASRTTIPEFGCRTSMSWETKTKDPLEVLTFAAKNDLL